MKSYQLVLAVVGAGYFVGVSLLASLAIRSALTHAERAAKLPRMVTMGAFALYAAIQVVLLVHVLPFLFRTVKEIDSDGLLVMTMVIATFVGLVVSFVTAYFARGMTFDIDG